MKNHFDKYEEARAVAQEQANNMQLSFGIEKLNGKWRVFMLPKPENRQGFELRCEVVDPTITKRKDQPKC